MHGHKHTDIHTTSANAVTLVWGLLRLTPNILSLMTHYITVCNCMKDSKSESKHISMGKEGSGESSLVFAGTFDCNQSDVTLIYLRCKTRSRVVTDTRLQDVCYLLVSQFQSCLTLPSTWLYCCLVVATLLAQVPEQALNCLYIHRPITQDHLHATLEVPQHWVFFMWHAEILYYNVFTKSTNWTEVYKSL